MKHRLLALILLLASFAVSAQVPTIYGASAPTDFARLVLQAQGITPTTTGISTGGKILASSVPAMTTATGVRIAVPVAVEATVSAAAVAGVAVKLARAASLAGWAFTGYEVYKAYQDSGLTTCAPPNFFCKPGVVTNTQPSSGGYWTPSTDPAKYPTAQAACTARFALMTYGDRSWYGGLVATDETTTTFRCVDTAGQGYSETDQKFASTCPSGWNVANYAQCTQNGLPSPGTDQELSDSITAPWASWTAARQKQWLDAIAKDAARSSGAVTGLDLIPANSPVSITAPAVTSPASIVKTETFANPDGSSSTRTTSETTTVTPTQSGSTMADKTLSFPSVTTQTISTTNNTTNVTTTTTNTINNASPTGAPTTASDFPKDYAKEATQQKIEADLNTDTAATMPDQTAVVNTAKTTADTARDTAITGAQTAQADHSAWFSWVWTPPTGTCALNTGVVHGYTVSWDICPTVANIRDVLGWLMALLSAITIYGQIFRKED